MQELTKLESANVFRFFEEICRIPRPSKKEGKIIEYLMSFAAQRQLKAKKDYAGNVLICKPASKGKKNIKPVVLQSHVDMVCEKNSGTIHDFENDPIKTKIKDGWIVAEGTTLGADCGIGMAAALALLDDKKLNHGPIECLFTVDEETGLTGAKALQPAFFEAQTLINLDSEDEGELFIGCAGGIDTLIQFTYSNENVPTDHSAFKISLSGLLGGHSGDDINKGRGNAIKIINQFLVYANLYDYRIHKFEGGNLRNAIPREAYLIVLVNNELVRHFKADFDVFTYEIKNEYKATEPNVNLVIEACEMPDFVIDEPTQFEIITSICGCPNGVLAMSFDVDGLVETSSNLASIKFLADNQILISTSQRSSIESKKRKAHEEIKCSFLLTSAVLSGSDGYPGWTPNINSEILKITETAYSKLFGKKPLIKAIHAGLECGLFPGKYPNLDMISFGPTIRGAHSPDERLEIATVDKFWKLLIEVLNNLP